MAASYRTNAAGGGSTGTSNRTVTITPAVGDLLVVFVNVSANTNDTPTMTDNNGSGTYTLIRVQNFNSTVPTEYRMAVFVRDALMVNTTSTVITAATGSNTSGELVVIAVSGMSTVGAAAIRQSAGESDGAAAGTPGPVFGSACLTGNMTLGAVGNWSNPAALTPPTNWTEAPTPDVGQASPAVGLETIYRNSGFTGTTVTWGGTSATAFCSIILELTPTTDVTVSPTGSAGTSSPGSVGITGGAVVSPSGSAATSAAGTPTETGSASVSPTGEQAVSSVGSVTIPDIEVFPSGSGLAASPGTMTVTGDASVAPTGEAASSASGSPAISGSAEVTPAGEAATSASGSPAITGTALVSPIGESATSAVGDVTVETTGGGTVDVTVYLTGERFIYYQGDPAVTGGATVLPAGETAATASGAVFVSGTAVVAPIGQSATSSVGNVSVSTGEVPPVPSTGGDHGKPRRRPKLQRFPSDSTVIVAGRAKPEGLTLNLALAEVRARAGAVIRAEMSALVFSMPATMKAKGIRNPSDEELVALFSQF